MLKCFRKNTPETKDGRWFMMESLSCDAGSGASRPVDSRSGLHRIVKWLTRSVFSPFLNYFRISIFTLLACMTKYRSTNTGGGVLPGCNDQTCFAVRHFTQQQQVGLWFGTHRDFAPIFLLTKTVVIIVGNQKICLHITRVFLLVF